VVNASKIPMTFLQLDRRRTAALRCNGSKRRATKISTIFQMLAGSVPVRPWAEMPVAGQKLPGKLRKPPE
jgi:hypothetical protein